MVHLKMCRTLLMSGVARHPLSVSGGLGLLQMVSELDPGQCASEDAGPRGVDTGQCASERGGSWDLTSIGERNETFFYKGVETSP